MKNDWIAKIVLGLCSICIASMSVSANAQDMTFSEDEAEDSTTEDSATEDSATEDSATEDSATEDSAEAIDADMSGEGDGDVIGDLAAEGEAEAPEAAGDAVPRVKEAKEDIFAVQRVFAMRANRVELAPSFGFTMNDPYVSHPSINLAINYWWTNVLAIGANFLWYEGLENESDLNFFVRRSTRLAIPITELQFGAYLNFTYVPFYGKFSGFNNFIFQWDSYIVGGVGLMRTRPVPVIDPEARSFDFDMRLAFNAGIGIRVFLTRWLTVFLEFRDYMYLEKHEALNVSLGQTDGCGGMTDARFCSDTWLDDSNTFTNLMTAQIGFTIYLPTSFDYKLPK